MKTIVAKAKKEIFNNRLFWLVFLIAAFLRLYNFYDQVTFLADQGRDAIIIYDIVTLTHLTAIGATTSIGGIYLGPFYYYFIAPFLALFNFDPAGLAYGVAFWSLIGLITSYYLVKKTSDKFSALVFSLLITFSGVNIYLSRFSWNPNLLPPFSFFTLYYFYRTIKQKDFYSPFIFGSLFAASIQLHYLAALLLPTFVVFFFLKLTTRKEILPFLKRLLVSVSGFFIVFSPLLIFDLKHDFINSQNLLKMFSNGDINSTPSLVNHFNQQKDVINAFMQHTFNYLPNFNISLIFLAVVFIWGIYLLRKEKEFSFFSISFTSFYLFLFVFAFINCPRYSHYFGPIYWLFYFVLAFIIIKIRPRLLKYFLLLTGFIFYLYFNFFSFKTVFLPGDKQIIRSKNVAESVSKRISNASFNVATWPVEFSENPYVYFLILNNQRPKDRSKMEVGKYLFVFCQQKPCLIINSPSWNISMFGKAKIAKIWQIEGLYLYQLIHSSK